MIPMRCQGDDGRDVAVDVGFNYRERSRKSHLYASRRFGGFLTPRSRGLGPSLHPKMEAVLRGGRTKNAVSPHLVQCPDPVSQRERPPSRGEPRTGMGALEARDRDGNQFDVQRP